MKKFIIERDIPGDGKLTPAELKAIAEKMVSAINEMSAPYQWVQTFVTDTKLYCIHMAPDQAAVLAHAEECGLPVTHLNEITSVIDSCIT